MPDCLGGKSVTPVIRFARAARCSMAEAVLHPTIATAEDLEAAAAALDLAQAAKPADGGMRLVRAALAMRRDTPDEALRIAGEGPIGKPPAGLVNLCGGDSTIAGELVELGDRLLAGGQRLRALAVWRLALEVGTDTVAARARLGDAALQDGRLDEALAHAWHVVDTVPRDPAALCRLGRALAACGHPEDAQQAFEQALALDATRVDAHRGLGALFVDANDKPRADLHLQRAIMLDHTHVDTLRRFGWFLHDTDRLERAEAIARLAVTAGPHDPSTHHLLGWILHRRNRLTAAHAALDKALDLAPDFVPALIAMAELELARGESAAAATRLRTAARLAPDAPQVQRLLAWALLDLRELEDAEAACRRALELLPGTLQIEVQLTWVLIDRQKHDEAMRAALALIAHHPDQPHGFSLLGEIHFRQRALEAAEDLLRRALERDPRHVPSLGRLGWILVELNRVEDAERTLRTVVTIDPGFAAGYRDLAFLLERQGRSTEAEGLLRTLIERRPADGHAWLALGRILTADGHLNEAVDAFARAAEIDGQIDEVWRQLGRLAARGVAAAERAFSRGSPDAIRRRLGDLINAAIGWLALDEYHGIIAYALERFPDDDLFQAARQFGLVYDPARAPDDLRANAERNGRHITVQNLSRRPRTGRPRIAYVGNFLHRELMGHVGFHDHDRFDIAIFTDDDAAAVKLAPRDPRFAIYPLGDTDLAQACAALSIDLVIDVVGPFPRESLLKAYRTLRQRVAPVQSLWLNTFSTTGSPAYDYVISDGVMVRPGDEHRFSERVLRLPHCQWLWAPSEHVRDPGPLPARANRHVTFGSANRGLKLIDPVLTLWAEAVASVPEARLRLIGWHGDDWRLRRRILAVFAEHGVGAERITFVPGVDPARSPDFYRDVDLTLDTFPFNGGMTTLEALWMGVPVVTLAGDRFTARQTESILRPLGLTEWVAPDRAAFVALAARLATDLDGLAAIRGSLRERMRASPLCDRAAYCRDLEALFVEMLGDT